MELVKFFEYGKKFIPLRTSGQIIRSDNVVNSILKSSKTTKAKESTRFSIGFVPQTLNNTTKQTKRVKVNGFRNDIADEEKLTEASKIKKFFDFFTKIFRKKTKTRMTAGFVPQELENHSKDKTRQKIGFTSLLETVPLNKRRKPMSDNGNTRITAGFVPQEVYNYHTAAEFLKSLWRNIKIRIKVATKTPSTRMTIGYNPQEVNNHLGGEITSKIGFTNGC